MDINLLSALRLPDESADKPACIAFTGSGGKTTAMFQLARQFITLQFERVFVTTTTHLAVSETLLADRVIRCTNHKDLKKEPLFTQKGIILICGDESSDQKMDGLSSDAVRQLWKIALEYQIPLLIEADGSRQRPLKAPADYEPVVPEFVSHVIVVAGLSGLGKRIDGQTVHRPEIYAKLCGQPVGTVITPEMVIKVLSNPIGGLKDIPAGAIRVSLLNQIDTQQSLREARHVARGLLPSFDQVILAELGPVRRGVRAVYEPIAGIILAAGSSSRFGGKKQLASWHGQTILEHVIRCALAGNFDSLRVVIGCVREEILPKLEKMQEFRLGQFSVIENSHWEQGQSSSIRLGIADLPARTAGAVFLLADQPFIPPQILEVLQDVRAFTRAGAVVPVYHNLRANPVLFGREIFPALSSLSGDRGGRSLLKEARFKITWLPWDDPGISLDIDTPDDYQRLIEMEAQWSLP